jgi:predicted Fe-S protein YdhL (DUF1289 family)
MCGGMPDPVPTAILSPCIGTCRLDAHGLCAGCLRTGDEIMRWRDMSEGERRHVMDVILPTRESC